ncbi:hypothetical protein TrST_g5327 [Triparma strigata]|uniref:BD-FAE-like domain-containing protein n=1 Tax=Triparma strigata TaxID=1606541 RepID=A0A9W7BP63_9STRA|nr:hypothetical protein TrST_g5327 [Triparma strigata]
MTSPPQPPAPPPKTALSKLVAFGQSSAFTKWMRVSLPFMNYVPLLSVAASIALTLTLSSPTAVLCAVTAPHLLLSVCAFSRSFSFVLGCLISDQPLMVLIPQTVFIALSLLSVLNNRSLIPSIDASENQHDKLLYVNIGVSALSIIIGAMNFVDSIKTYNNFKVSIEQSNLDANTFAASVKWYDFIKLYSLFPLPYILEESFNNKYLSRIKQIQNATFATRSASNVTPILKEHVEGDKLNLSCDIYYTIDDDYEKRDEPSSGKPVVLYIHGGAWMLGSKDLGVIQPFINEAVYSGYIVLSVDYRLAPSSPWPACLIDIKECISWVRRGGVLTHVKDVEIDIKTIVVAGDSAGGHLANLVILTENLREYQPGFEKVDTAVQGVIDMFGPSDIREPESTRKAWEECIIQKSFDLNKVDFDNACPVTYDDRMKGLKGRGLPWLQCIGTRDGLVPIEINREYYYKLLTAMGKAFDAPLNASTSFCWGHENVVRCEIQGSFHGFCGFRSVKTQLFLKAARLLLEEVKQRKGTGGKRGGGGSI